MKRSLVIAFISLLSTLVAFSQEVTITDAYSGIPLEGVVITLGGSVTQSNSRGMATLSHFPEQGELLFTHPSYHLLRIEIQRLPQMKYRVRMVEAPLSLEEVVVSVSREEQLRFTVPRKVESLPSGLLTRAHPPTTADLTGLSGEVFIQKSQQGGGSPMIRGFSANRLLLVIDGVRMNNAIYRSGNLQNIVSVDANMLETTEILPGPGSVAYGSDALGGVLSFITHKPKLSTSEKMISEGYCRVRLFSAEQGGTLHFRWGAGAEKWGFLLGGTRSVFGNLRMGRHGPAEYLRNEYTLPSLFSGRDSIVRNNNPRMQRPTAYNQTNLTSRVRYKPSPQLEINLGGQFSGTSAVPRYDRLIVYRKDKLRYGDWHYGPQEWTLVNGSIDYHPANPLFDKVRIIPAYQYYAESRHDRSIDDPLLFNRKEKLHIYTLSVDFHKELLPAIRFSFGTEGTFNKVISRGWSTHLLTGETLASAPRYPALSHYASVAGYLSGHWEALPELSLEGGIRGTLTHTDGEFSPESGFPESSFSQTNRAVNGSLGTVWRPFPEWLFRALASTGFRAPNIDDMAKVFDSEPGNVIVPNPTLKPEYARNLEAGLAWIKENKVRMEATFFLTDLKGAMVRRPFLFNGRDSIPYNGTMSRVEALVNADGAILAGATFSAGYYFTPLLRTTHSLTAMTGHDSDGYPLRHIPPLYGSSALCYDRKPWFAEINLRYNGKIPYSRLAPDERDKPYLYLPDKQGNPYSPAWMTIGLFASYDFTPAIQLSAGIENLTNRRYRPYSSGIAAPGTSLVISLSGKI